MLWPFGLCWFKIWSNFHNFKVRHLTIILTWNERLNSKKIEGQLILHIRIYRTFLVKSRRHQNLYHNFSEKTFENQNLLIKLHNLKLIRVFIDQNYGKKHSREIIICRASHWYYNPLKLRSLILKMCLWVPKGNAVDC